MFAGAERVTIRSGGGRGELVSPAAVSWQWKGGGGGGPRQAAGTGGVGSGEVGGAKWLVSGRSWLAAEPPPRCADAVIPL